MSYEKFSNAAVGDVINLIVDFGQFRFVKCSSTMYMVEIALKNLEPFIYTRFAQSLTTIEASYLFDKYSK